MAITVDVLLVPLGNRRNAFHARFPKRAPGGIGRPLDLKINILVKEAHSHTGHRDARERRR
eukprot:11172712-Lingulodinium_polyedra.AAC.1